MRKKLAVFSHHRSGTHFLMKSLALNSIYVDEPPLLLDVNLGRDLWNPHDLRNMFQQLSKKELLNIAKCHFDANFFKPIIQDFLQQFDIVYIVRRPEDALKSYFDFAARLDWPEAPNCKTIDEFVRAAPSGSCLRWQSIQYETMAHRWKGHVDGWLDLASKNPDIHIITYEQLHKNFNDCMNSLTSALGWSKNTNNLAIPNKTGILPGNGGSHEEHYQPETLDWLKNLCEETYQQAVHSNIKLKKMPIE